MFNKANLGRVWWPVIVTGYDRDGREVEKTIRLLLQPLTRKELNERVAQESARLDELRRVIKEQRAATKAAADSEQAADEALDRTLDDLLARYRGESTEQLERNLAEIMARTHDWAGVVDDDGKPYPFDREHFAALLEHNWFAGPVFQAFEACSKGAVRKNSQPGPAGAPGPVQS